MRHFDTTPSMRYQSTMPRNSSFGQRTPFGQEDRRSQSTTTSLSSGTKRKRSTEVKFYAVRVGHQPGIYHNWPDCFAQVKGYKNATYKSFPTLTEAENFINFTETGAKSKFYYAVQNGRVPGVYTDWPSAQAQIKGWTKPKHRRFATRSEAEAFVAAATSGGSITSVNTTISADFESDQDEVVYKQAKMPPSKKQKKASSGATGPETTPALSNFTADVLTDPGNDPLPDDAQDGFDRRVLLNPRSGTVEYKTPEQLGATKLQPTGHSKGQWLKVYTDGSALGNGKAGAVAGVGVYFGPGDARNISEPLSGARQTNQRAELTAIQRALDLSPFHMNLHIFSDSYYGIRCCTEWYPSWRRNGWMTTSRKPVENKDIIEKIVEKIEDRERAGVSTKLEWVKGHSAEAGNVAADQLAVAGANGARRAAVGV